MTGTVTGILIMCVVIVLALAAWLLLVARAARRPGDNRHVQPMRGLVQGGEHVGGGGRSVMPHRDAPVPEGGGDAPTPEEMIEGQTEARGPGSSPMDL
jgi:hypothetical protein